MKVLQRNGAMEERSFDEAIGKESLSLQVYEVEKKEILAQMEQKKEAYKIEMIQELPEEEKITCYQQGDYVEFCVGPHVSNTCQIKALKLLSVAGAYWRGDENSQMPRCQFGTTKPRRIISKRNNSTYSRGSGVIPTSFWGYLKT